MGYTTKVNKIESKPGYWNTLLVEIFKDEVKIGEYKRNYSTLFRTFCPFTVNGKDYALYSSDYTSTRLMSLPDCKDLGGESRSAGGFCPTDYYVPEICVQWPRPDDNDPQPISPTHDTKRFVIVDEAGKYHYPSDTKSPYYSFEKHQAYEAEKTLYDILYKQWYERHPFTDMTAPFGFVAGCVWGDDSAWKIQYLDLSRVDEGIIQRDERFGYIELPAGLTLEQAIDADVYDPDDFPYVDIATTTRYHITGKKHPVYQ